MVNAGAAHRFCNVPADSVVIYGHCRKVCISTMNQAVAAIVRFVREMAIIGLTNVFMEGKAMGWFSFAQA